MTADPALASRLSGPPILVTGAAGFIGFHVSRSLLDLGLHVVGLDNLNNYYDPGLKTARLEVLQKYSSFDFQKLDLQDFDGIAALFASHRPRFVVHLAAQAGVRYSIDSPRSYVGSNLDGFLSILEGCRRWPVDHLVYASSSSVYGLNKKTPFTEIDPADHPASLYGATKRANELMAHSYAHLFQIPVTGLRFFTVYGPWGRPDMAYFKFTKAILAGEAIDVYDIDNMWRDFTFINDVVRSICELLPLAPSAQVHVADASQAPRFCVFNIGNHTPVSLRLFVETLEQVIGKRAELRHLPAQAGDVSATHADVSKLKSFVGFEPYTPLEEGLSRFVRWYREYGAQRKAATSMTV